MPSRSVPRSRMYSNVTFDPSTGLIVAASCLESRFANFDEEGVKTWEPDGMKSVFCCRTFLELTCIFPIITISHER